MTETNQQTKKRPSGKKLIPWVLRPGAVMLGFIQNMFNRIFTPAFNPLYFLGAITFFLLWILFFTGVYLFLFYDINPSKVYDSVQYVTIDQKYYGGIIRSLHRYASDLLVVVIGLHLMQVLFSDRFRRHRWLAWVTGVVILPTIWLEGISGYMLVWDQRAQALALKVAELFDKIPIMVDPLSRAFISNDSLSSSFFFVLNYGHLAIPCFLLVIAWIHCLRVTRPLISPPARLGWPIGISLLAVCIIFPATSLPPADLGKLVGDVGIDWFYLGLFPLLHWLTLTPTETWLYGITLYLMFVALPWLVRDAAAPPSLRPVIDGTSCIGCDQCLMVCPFEAVSLEKKATGAGREAVITPSRCGECGFCVTSCEFGAISVDGVTRSVYREKIEGLLHPEGAEILLFLCERTFDDLENLIKNERLVNLPEVAVLTLPCIGIVSPALIDYAENAGAKGICVLGCHPLDCHYRAARRKGAEGIDAPLYVESMTDQRVRLITSSANEQAEAFDLLAAYCNEVKK